MTIAIRALHPVIGGEVSGLDLAQPLTPDEIAAVEAGMDRCAVLVLPGQRISDEQQIAFKHGAQQRPTDRVRGLRL